MGSVAGNWSFMNDDAGLAGETCENWIITADESDNSEIVAVVPKTGDEDYDNSVTFPRVLLLSTAPELLEMCQRSLAALIDPDSDDWDADAFQADLIAAIAKATGGAA